MVKLELGATVWVLAKERGRGDDFMIGGISLVSPVRGKITTLAYSDNENDSSQIEYHVTLEGGRGRISRTSKSIYETEEEAKNKGDKLNKAISFLQESDF